MGFANKPPSLFIGMLELPALSYISSQAVKKYWVGKLTFKVSIKLHHWLDFTVTIQYLHALILACRCSMKGSILYISTAGLGIWP